MPLPIAQIIAAAAPLVMNAVDLYRRRNEAASGAGGGGDVHRRLRELEDADREQSRLISELARSLEALARHVEVTNVEIRRKEDRIRRLIWTIGGLAALSVALAIWAIVK